MLQPKPNIDKLGRCIHGGIDYVELKNLGISPGAILDFSVCCSPFGPPPGVREALASTSIENYPDSEASELKQLLAEKLNVATDNFIIGSGSTELIRLLTIAYFDSGDVVLIPQPTYGEYEIACHIIGAQVLKQPVASEPSFCFDIAETTALIREYRPKGVFLCNPNNPTGQYLSKEEIERVMSMMDGLLVLDEAYIAFTENAWPSQDLVDSGNLVILRSMTKDYALAGLRLGYAIAAKPIISTLKRICPPWNVNALAQKAGSVAINAESYLEECSRKISEAKAFLVKELECLGLSPLPSQTNFFLVKVGNAAKFRQDLLIKGFLVRDCSSFGLPDHIRLATRSLPECQKLIKAIKEVIELNHGS